MTALIERGLTGFFGTTLDRPWRRSFTLSASVEVLQARLWALIGLGKSHSCHSSLTTSHRLSGRTCSILSVCFHVRRWNRIGQWVAMGRINCFRLFDPLGAQDTRPTQENNADVTMMLATLKCPSASALNKRCAIIVAHSNFGDRCILGLGVGMWENEVADNLMK